MRSRERPGDRQWTTKDRGVGAALLESGFRSSCVFFAFGRKANLAVNDGSSIIHSYRHPHPRILFSIGQELDQEEVSFTYSVSPLWHFPGLVLLVSHSEQNMNNLEVACICCLFSKLQRKKFF